MIQIDYTYIKYRNESKIEKLYGIVIFDGKTTNNDIICKFDNEEERNREINEETILDVLEGENYPLYVKAKKLKYLYFNDVKIQI